LRIPGGILSLLLLILPLWPTASQDLSTYVSPSEDEWLQALTLGEISYVQYLCLIEIARHGIDSSSLYLLDEIPNLSYFWSANQGAIRLPLSAKIRGRRKKLVSKYRPFDVFEKPYCYLADQS